MDAYGASPSSSCIQEKYDVFLSFRGEDTRNNFTSHLYAALKRKQIETYIDENSLERGDDIALALPEAIQKSRISIIIFSKDYASSSWCLRELEHILECRRGNKQMVIPVFYKVDPSDIRKQEGSYREAFLKHQERFKDRTDIVQKWRAALTESADLSGWDLQVTRPEAQLVEAIAADVLRKLNRLPSADVSREELIGIKQYVQEIELLLCLGSPDIRLIGIWGLGGIGKTTLADVIFNKHCYQFESHCFLANVREESEKHGLINLRDKLICKLLKEESMNLGTPSLPPHVKDRLCRQKVLIVFDDVNDSEQLLVLVGHRDLFGHGSRIIITTRDAKVLKDIEVDGTCMVRQLENDEALQLFKLEAFRGNSPTTDYIELSKEMVKYAGGIPLAIHILASHLRSLYPKSIENWETTLSCLKEISHDDIEKKLKISFDGLNKKEQAIFLDIACFFKGECRKLVENVLNGCGFSASILVNNLSYKSLITIHGDRVWMHDLVQEMGWKIVQQQSEDQPGQQSRLWIAKDAYQVLNNNKGSEKIEGIFLDMHEIGKALHLSPDVFQKMSRLRLLKIYNVSINKVYLHQDLQSLPDTLRYLHWERYPSKCLPSSFEPQNLIEINMPHSQLEQLSNEVMEFDNLRGIDLGHSIHLTQFPDFSHAPKLEQINLEGSTSLLQVSLQNLDKLTHLNLSYCSKLQTIPMIITRSLISLNLSSTSIEYLPSSIEGCFSLTTIDLSDCNSLESLPTSIFRMRSLDALRLNGCSNLKNLPEISEPMESLKELYLYRSGIRQLPSSIGHLIGLELLDMDECEKLESIPSSIFNLARLWSLLVRHCPKLEYFPILSGSLSSDLGIIYLINSSIREIPENIKEISNLRELYITNCKNLCSLPELPLTLEVLDASGCESLKVVLNSRRPLTQKFWFNYHKDNFFEYLMFCDCLKLDEKERDNIIREFQLRVLRMATLFAPPKYLDGYPKVHLCCPGYEIPKWFEYQWEGSSINIELPPNWHKLPNFLGFVVCAVVDSYSDVMNLQLTCEFNLKSNQREISNFTWRFTDYETGYGSLPYTLSSSNVYMWYRRVDYYKCLDAKEASFDFSFQGQHKKILSNWIETFGPKVKKCGIHMLYHQDKEKFISSRNQHLVLEELDEITNQPESSARGTIDFVAEEPQSKRTKF